MARHPPFPRICIALGLSDPAPLLEQALREVDAGESFLEVRLDYLPRPEQGLAVIRDLLRKRPSCEILATCRRHQNHGRFNGAIEGQLKILEGAAEAGARNLDVEIESAEAARDKLDNVRHNARLIVSYHNFESTPQMDTVLKRMSRIPADAYKIVTTARKPSDIARLLALSKANPRVPLIVLAMGEIGFPTRVLATCHGGLYTYAAPQSCEGTAAGQVTAKQLRHMYRIEKLTKDAKIYGVIGDPVLQSISPAVHNRAFQARRMDAVYLPFLVPEGKVQDFWILAEKVPLAGFSVTIPHKERVIKYLDIVEPAARRIGAVNTVWRKGGKWRGKNTDAPAVSGPLAKRLRLANASVLVVGSGGGARGAVHALAEERAQVFVTGRRMERVRALAKTCRAEALTCEDALARHFDALVHATSLGMFPHVEGCFFDGKIPADVVFDIVYNPAETVLLKRAAEQGKTVISGLEMFVDQAVRQFETWTGETAPRAVMESAAREALQAKYNSR